MKSNSNLSPKQGNPYYFAETAKAGDICALLVPNYVESLKIRKQVQELRSSYGGEFAKPIHLTCQRFSASPRQIEALLPRLVRLSARTKPIKVVGATLEPFYSPFYKKEILKCRIEANDELQSFSDALAAELADLGIEAHFPWASELVTLLEDIARQTSQEEDYAKPLFLARHVVLTRIRAPGRYDALFSSSMSKVLEPISSC